MFENCKIVIVSAKCYTHFLDTHFLTFKLVTFAAAQSETTEIGSHGGGFKVRSLLPGIDAWQYSLWKHTATCILMADICVFLRTVRRSHNYGVFQQRIPNVEVRRTHLQFCSLLIRQSTKQFGLITWAGDELHISIQFCTFWEGIEHCSRSNDVE
jgi:hypothetical protein